MEIKEFTIGDVPERRISHRNRSFKVGTVRFNRGLAAMECNIRDFHECGARLDLASTAGVPSTFDLETSDGKKRGVEVRWRTMDRLGVEYVN